MSSDRIVLVGPRGSGKSTVGPLLAERLGLPFDDSDALVEKREGRGIAELMAAGSFREAERQAVAHVLAGPAGVVAVGGGAVLWPGFASAASSWTVVWLDARAEVLAGRIRGSDRPSLTGRPVDEEIADVAAERAPLYAAVARWRIDTSELTPDEAAHRIEKLLRNDDKTGSRSAD
jgi:shikimate kinase